MARNDESQRGAGAPSRVYKSSDVHKRRVDRKGREKRVEKAPEPERAIAPAQPPLPDDASPTAPDAASETGRNAVVITPEFGRKTDAQREADDRWFAAMRENDLPARRLDIPEVNPKPVDDRQTIPSSAQRTRDVSAAALAQEPAGAASPPVEDAPAASPSEPPMPQREEGRPTAGIEPPVNHASETAPTARFGAGAAGAFAAREKMSVKRRIVLVIALILVAIVAVAAAWFTWNRWYRYDDSADMQGTWYVLGTTVPVTIEGDAIRLTDDVTYRFELNSQDKTIRYVFGPMEGHGRYWFSDDRKYLVITDGDQFTSADTAIEDLLREFSELPDRAAGNEPKMPEGEGIIAFSREPDAAAAAKEQAEAEAKKKAEEDARKEAERVAAEEAAREAAEAEQQNYEEEPPAEESPAEQEPPADNQRPEGERAEA